MRPRFQWDIGRRSLALGERTLIMGVLNVTPDSFSDGGRFLSPQAAIAHGLELLDEGANILDIGGESTRPGVSTASGQAPSLAGAVSAQEEIDRVLPILQAIRQQRPQAVLSIDTYKSTVAHCALEAGAEIVNDVSGFTWDSAMAATIAANPCGSILMHVRGLPHQWRTLPPAPDIVSLVSQELCDRVSAALDAGIVRGSIVLDPGFGFGKNFDENYPLLTRFAEFHSLGFPLLAAVSRKSFLGRTVAARLSEIAGAPHLLAGAPHLPQSADVGLPSDRAKSIPIPPAARDTATLAATVAAALAGAHIVRVHAVRPAVEALAVADAILRAESPF
jgi:dihydropteroate synthase